MLIYSFEIRALAFKKIDSASVHRIMQCGLGGQKLYNRKKRYLSSRMRPKCGPNLDLLRSISRYFHQNAVKSLNSTFCDKSAMLFIMNGLLYHPISIKLHVLTLVLNLIDSSLSLFHSFAATFLS